MDVVGKGWQDSLALTAEQLCLMLLQVGACQCISEVCISMETFPC